MSRPAAHVGQVGARAARDVKTFFKRWPRLYNVLFWVVGPSIPTFTSYTFARRLDPDARLLNAGSGTKRIRANSINVDLLPLSGVDVVADLADLPFENGAFDAVTCEQVLEHVPAPLSVARELQRVTRPGGLIHVSSPFLFPWHPSPSDYTRWTQEGLRELFSGCEVVEQGVASGPCSAMTAMLAAFFATILCFGSRPVQSALQYLFLVLFIPLKLLDVIFAHLPGAELCASNFYLIVRKPGSSSDIPAMHGPRVGRRRRMWRRGLRRADGATT